MANLIQSMQRQHMHLLQLYVCVHGDGTLIKLLRQKPSSNPPALPLFTVSRDGELGATFVQCRSAFYVLGCFFFYCRKGRSALRVQAKSPEERPGGEAAGQRQM